MDSNLDSFFFFFREPGEDSASVVIGKLKRARLATSGNGPGLKLGPKREEDRQAGDGF
jgi:hypothetical protein